MDNLLALPQDTFLGIFQYPEGRLAEIKERIHMFEDTLAFFADLKEANRFIEEGREKDIPESILQSSLVAVFVDHRIGKDGDTVITCREKKPGEIYFGETDETRKCDDLDHVLGWRACEIKVAHRAYEEALANRDAIPLFTDAFEISHRVTGTSPVRTIVSVKEGAFDFAPALTRAAQWYQAMAEKFSKTAAEANPGYGVDYESGKGRPKGPQGIDSEAPTRQPK